MPQTPRLLVLSEQLRGKTFELSGDLHACGRLQSNHICIDDPTISSHHCDFVRKGSTYVVKDRNSTNGTRVNNVPVVEQELHSSDILQVGGVEILYDCEEKSISTMVVRTQTGINLTDTDLEVSSVKDMRNFDPFAKKSGGGMSHKIMIGIVALLIILVVVLIFVLALMMKGA